jgi:simple sugar transport system permease protein
MSGRLLLLNPAFLSPLNISNLLTFMVELGLIALGMTVLMTSGEFDLSVGSCSASRRC